MHQAKPEGLDPEQAQRLLNLLAKYPSESGKENETSYAESDLQVLESNQSSPTPQKQSFKEVRELPESCAFCHQKMTRERCEFCGAWTCASCGHFNGALDDKCNQCYNPRWEKGAKDNHAGDPIPQEIVQTLFLIALQQPIPLLLLFDRRGAGVLKDIRFLERQNLIRIEGKVEHRMLVTTGEFATRFGLDQDVKKMQAELRAGLERFYHKIK